MDQLHTVFERMRKKSWKREVAALMLGVLLGMGIFVLAGTDGSLMESRGRVLELFVYPIFLFAGAAYGFQSFTDQYVPKKAQADRTARLPLTKEELAMLTPPGNPEDDVTVVGDQKE